MSPEGTEISAMSGRLLMRPSSIPRPGAQEIIAETAWTPSLEAAWPALRPVFGASTYLASLARRDPRRLGELLDSDPDARLADVLERTRAVGELTPAGASGPCVC